MRYLMLHPGEQRGPDVEAHPGIIIHNVNNCPLFIQNAGGSISGIALGIYTVVPVVIGIGRILDLHFIEPGVFTRWLIKMPMYAQIFLARFTHKILLILKYT